MSAAGVGGEQYSSEAAGYSQVVMMGGQYGMQSPPGGFGGAEWADQGPEVGFRRESCKHIGNSN